MELVLAPSDSGQPLVQAAGLVPSRPGDLAGSVTDARWFAQRCAALSPGTTGASGSEAMSKLDAIGPFLVGGPAQGRADWQRDMACFGVQPAAYFTTLRMLYQAFVTSAHYQALRGDAGMMVEASAVRAQLGDYTPDGPVALRCTQDRAGRAILHSVVFSIDLASIEWFPAPASLRASGGTRDDCPARFLVPGN